jgi:hypothetical protein
MSTITQLPVMLARKASAPLYSRGVKVTLQAQKAFSAPAADVFEKAASKRVPLTPEETAQIRAVSEKAPEVLVSLPGALAKELDDVLVRHPEGYKPVTPQQAARQLAEQAKRYATMVEKDFPDGEFMSGTLKKYAKAQDEQLKILGLPPEVVAKLKARRDSQMGDPKKFAQAMLMVPVMMAKYLLALTHAGIKTAGTDLTKPLLTGAVTSTNERSGRILAKMQADIAKTTDPALKKSREKVMADTLANTKTVLTQLAKQDHPPTATQLLGHIQGQVENSFRPMAEQLASAAEKKLPLGELAQSRASAMMREKLSEELPLMPSGVRAETNRFLLTANNKLTGLHSRIVAPKVKTPLVAEKPPVSTPAA